MKSKERNAVINAIRNNEIITSDCVMMELGRSKMSRKLDNSVMRFLRRLHERGYLRRIKRGEYRLTPRGKKSRIMCG